MVSFMLCNIRNYEEVIKCLGRNKIHLKVESPVWSLNYFLRAEILARFKIKTHIRKPFLDLKG